MRETMAKPKLHIHVPSLPHHSYEYRHGYSILIYDKPYKDGDAE